jgi:excisionase family DNA binding protein
MRSSFARTVSESERPDLLTTGEVAQLLGTSRQHVVNLCDGGDLPFVLVGRHRRISRRDVQTMLSGTRSMSRDQLKSWWLSHAIAAQLVKDPQGVIAIARDNLRRMEAAHPRGSARVWFEAWKQLLEGDVEVLVDALTSRSPLSRELRQNNPFAGVLSETERQAALAGFASIKGPTKP